MAFQKKLTPKQTRELLVDYQDGWKVAELSVIYRISIRTVYRILAEHEVPRQKGKRKRKPAKRPKPPRELYPCGTNAAYARHKRKGEYPCTPCLEAHAQNVSEAKYGKRKGDSRNGVKLRSVG